MHTRLKLVAFILIVLIFCLLRGRNQDYAYYITIWFILIYALTAGLRELLVNRKAWERKYVYIHGIVLVLVAAAIVIGFIFFLGEFPKLALFLALLALIWVYVIMRYDNEKSER